MERHEITMNWSEWHLLVIIDGELFACILSRFDCLRTDHLSKEIIVFQVIIFFVLMFQTDSLVCFS